MKLVQEVNIEVSDQERTCWGNVSVQNLFAEMDEEEDGHVYVKQVVVTLKALNQDIDHNLKVVHMLYVDCSTRLCIPILNLQVKNILDELDNDEKTEATVSFKEFKDLMVILEEAGWRKQKPKKVISFAESSFNFKSFWYHIQGERNNWLQLCSNVLQFPIKFTHLKYSPEHRLIVL